MKVRCHCCPCHGYNFLTQTHASSSLVSVLGTQLVTAGQNKKEAAVISSKDAEPVLGFASFLPDQEWKLVRLCTADWIVRAKTYVDTLWISREDIIDCFECTYGPFTFCRYFAFPHLCCSPVLLPVITISPTTACSSPRSCLFCDFVSPSLARWADGQKEMVDNAYELYHMSQIDDALRVRRHLLLYRSCTLPRTAHVLS